MNKSSKTLIVFFIILGIFLVIFFVSNKMNEVNQSYISDDNTKKSINKDNLGNIYLSENKSNNIVNYTDNLNINTLNEYLEKNNTSIEEKEISSFSTPLGGDENRLENIKISCNTINGKILKDGETFSFNEVVGKPTEERGYKEADVIIGTKLEKGLGGGNCQVSTTLYNACLNIKEIEIVERNPHKRKVTYVEEGKDASVSYGTLDLKFTNHTGSSIMILMNSEDNKVTAKILKI